MNLKDGKLSLSQDEMRRIVAHGLNAMFIGTIDVKVVYLGSSTARPFEIILGEPVPAKVEKKK